MNEVSLLEASVHLRLIFFPVTALALKLEGAFGIVATCCVVALAVDEALVMLPSASLAKTWKV
jgi:hypothetical protein